MINKRMTIQFEPREDGGVRIFSDDIPGLILSHPDWKAVLLDLGPALIVLLGQHEQTGPG